MQDICRVDVFEAAEDLVHEVASMIVAQFLCLQQLVKISFHQALYDVASEASRLSFTTFLRLNYLTTEIYKSVCSMATIDKVN